MAYYNGDSIDLRLSDVGYGSSGGYYHTSTTYDATTHATATNYYWNGNRVYCDKKSYRTIWTGSKDYNLSGKKGIVYSEYWPDFSYVPETHIIRVHGILTYKQHGAAATETGELDSELSSSASTNYYYIHLNSSGYNGYFYLYKHSSDPYYQFHYQWNHDNAHIKIFTMKKLYCYIY